MKTYRISKNIDQKGGGEKHFFNAIFANFNLMSTILVTIFIRKTIVPFVATSLKGRFVVFSQ